MLCFRDRICDKGRFGKDRGGFYDGHYSLGEAERPSHSATLIREGLAELAGKRKAITVRKTYAFRKGGLSVEYEITNRDAADISLRLGVELNLAAGVDPKAIGLSALEGRGERELDPAAECAAEGLVGLRLSNLAKEEKIEARSDRPFVLAHSPVRSSSMYQGCLLLLGYDLDLAADSSQRLSLTLELRS